MPTQASLVFRQFGTPESYSTTLGFFVSLPMVLRHIVDRPAGYIARCRSQYETTILLYSHALCATGRAALPTDKPVFVRACQQIDTLLPGDAMVEARKTAKTEMAARRKKWNRSDKHFGYSRTRHTET
jgi:hypothetical protein